MCHWVFYKCIRDMHMCKSMYMFYNIGLSLLRHIKLPMINVNLNSVLLIRLKVGYNIVTDKNINFLNPIWAWILSPSRMTGHVSSPSSSGVFEWNWFEFGIAKWMISTFLWLVVVHHQQPDTNLGKYLNHLILTGFSEFWRNTNRFQ